MAQEISNGGISEITFLNFDKFNREPLAKRLTKVIESFSPFCDEAFVLGLNARYGTGKTTFLKMWQSYLEEEGFSVLCINAWETDFDNEPLIPILSALLSYLPDEQDAQKVKSAFRGALIATLLGLNGIVSSKLGIDFLETLEETKSCLEGEDIQKAGDEIFKQFSFKRRAYENLKESLATYVATLEKRPLIIFVDELDRVRPDYAVSFLEAIKHIFSVRGVCFVIAVDRKQISLSIQQLYGNIDFESYYRRFVTREVNLPEAWSLDISDFVKRKFVDFFDRKEAAEIKFAFGDNSDELSAYICRALKLFKFTGREVDSFFRVFTQSMAIKKEGKLAHAWIKASIVLICLFIKDRDLYSEVGASSLPVNSLKNHIEKIISSEDLEDIDIRNFYIDVAAYGTDMSNQQNIDETVNLIQSLLEGAGISSRASDILHSSLGDKYGVSHRGRLFTTVYKHIEEWKEFL